jgi:MATE family multidrug resistance protein
LLKRDGFLWRFGQLAIANIISNLMVPLASIIDTAFLGHLAEIRHLGGVALATVIFNVVYWTFGFLRMGTTGLTAQAQGRGDQSGLYYCCLEMG